MKNNRMYELGKSRVSDIKLTDICSSTVIGIFSLWAVWISTSLLIHFAK